MCDVSEDTSKDSPSEIVNSGVDDSSTMSDDEMSTLSHKSATKTDTSASALDPTAVNNEEEIWYKHPKYKRYWSHYKVMQDWFQKHSDVAHEAHAQKVQKECEDWYRSYWNYQVQTSLYHSYTEYVQWWQSVCANHNQGSMLPGQPGFHGNWPHSGNQPNHSKARKRNRTSPNLHANEKRMRNRGQSLHDDIGIEEEHEVNDSEFEMEINEEMVQFFVESAKHKEERDTKKKEEADKNKDDDYINLGDASALYRNATKKAPTQRPGIKRTMEMKYLYGKGAAMIHGMETAMQLTFDRNCDIKQSKLWPYLPLNIKFDA